jgi:signal transduction histidine kinase
MRTSTDSRSEPGKEHAVWNDLVHTEDRDQARTKLHDALARHADSYEVEYRLRRIDGSYAAVLDRASIIYDKSGHPLRLVGAMTDLSEFRRLEEQFRQAQKLEAVGLLARGVAHDFNNLLMVISGYTQNDPDQFAQALLNLCVNARDAMPKGGRLTIATQSVLIDAESAEGSPIPPAEYALLTVADTGLGMTQGIQTRIFEPFFTTKEPGKGTGLGLSMVHSFVKQCGGLMQVESRLGHGSSFKLYFPRAEEPQSEA